MKLDHRSVHPLATFAMAIFVLVACQNSTEPNSNNSGPMKATAGFTVSEPAQIPDSINWNSAHDAGQSGLVCNGKKCTETLSLKQPLGSDVANVQLWVLGIRFATFHYTQSGSSPTLDLQKNFEIDAMDLKLLQDFYAYRQTKDTADSLAKAGPLASDLVYYYARNLMGLDTNYTKYSSTPVGMNNDSIKTALVYWGQKAGKSVAQLAKLNLVLPLDTGFIRNAVSILIKAKLLSAGDSTALFPPYPVRVTSPISVSGTVTAGGNAASVSGAFSWTSGKIGSAAFQVLNSKNGVDSTHFTVGQQKYITPSDSVWNLSNNVKVQATADVDTGSYTLVVTVSVDSGRSATSKAPFTVKGAIPGAPKIQRLAPVNQTGNTLPFETDSLYVAWLVFNWKDLYSDSVFIGTAKAVKLTDSTWGQKVFIAPTGQVSTVTFRVVGKSNDAATDYVQVSRAKDTAGPSIQWVSPSISINVDATVSSAKVQVKATDPSGVDSVYIQGLPAHNDSGSYWSASVTLGVANGKPLPLAAKALDKNHNPSVDSSISITRNAPSGTDNPTLTIQLPSATTNNTLVFDSTTLHVVYKITDYLTSLDTSSIRFGTVVPKRLTDSTWAADVPVPATGAPNSILVQAANKSGGGNSEIIVVTRSKDLVNPVIVKAPATKTRTVAFDTASASLSWTVSDNYKVWSITLNGNPLPVSPIVTQTMRLTVGTDSFFLVATDTFGNFALDTVVITRLKDQVKPVVAITSPTDGTFLAYGTTTVSVIVKATDAGSGVMSVLVNGSPVDAFGKAAINLGPGKTSITAIATDNAGNMDSAKVNVTVAADTVGPDLTITRPSRDTTVLFGTKTISVSAKASDTVSGLATIVIGGTTCTASPCTATGLDISTGKITVIATDKAGKMTSKFVNVKIGTDTTAPFISRNAGTANVSVPFSTTSATVSWIVTDNDAVDSVKIGGTPVLSGPGGVYSKTVDLSLGQNVITIDASDKTGNHSTDKVTVTRKDDVFPVIQASSVATQTVAFDVKTISLSWTVSDNVGISTLFFNKVPLAVASTVTKTDLPLSVGNNTFTLVATDAAGNATPNVVTIVRLKDNIDPTIVRTSVPSSPVEFGKPITVSFTVKDNDGVYSVTLNGKPMTKTGNVYNYPLPMSTAGDNPVDVLATDSTGNSTHDIFVLMTIATDRDRNIYSIGKMPDGKVWTLQNAYAQPLPLSIATGEDPYLCTEAGCIKGISYTWAAAMDQRAECNNGTCPLADSLKHQGVCPTNWHIASTQDWTGLVVAAGGGDTALGEKRLKTTSGWASTINGINADYSGTDDLGFHLYPTHTYGGRVGGGSRSLIWTPTDDAASGPNSAIGAYFAETFGLWPGQEKTQRSVVRCIAN